MDVLVLWVFFAMLVGVVALKFGRTFLGYTLLALLISPLLGIIVVLCVGHKAEDTVSSSVQPTSKVQPSNAQVPSEPRVSKPSS